MTDGHPGGSALSELQELFDQPVDEFDLDLRWTPAGTATDELMYLPTARDQPGETCDTHAATCADTCKGTCPNTCHGTCPATCHATCQDTCRATCQDTCHLTCEGTCTQTHLFTCRSGCEPQ